MAATATPAKAPTSRATILFVLGPPGAGKGTLFKRLANDHGYCHLSVGDYLRELSDRTAKPDDAAYGGLSRARLQSDLQARKLFPGNVLTEILAYKIGEECKDGRTKFIVDGFPRSLESAVLFEEKIAMPLTVFWAHCDRETAKQRYLERKRGDDDGAVFDKRYAEYTRLNGIIVQRYKSILHELDTTGDPEETYLRLLKLHREAVEVSDQMSVL